MLCLYNALCTKFSNNQKNKVKSLILILNLSTVTGYGITRTSLPHKNTGIYLLIGLWFGNRILLGLVSSGAPGSLANHQNTPHPRTQHTDATQKGLSPLPLLSETEFSLINLFQETTPGAKRCALTA